MRRAARPKRPAARRRAAETGGRRGSAPPAREESARVRVWWWSEPRRGAPVSRRQRVTRVVSSSSPRTVAALLPAHLPSLRLRRLSRSRAWRSLRPRGAVSVLGDFSSRRNTDTRQSAPACSVAAVAKCWCMLWLRRTWRRPLWQWNRDPLVRMCSDGYMRHRREWTRETASPVFLVGCESGSSKLSPNCI